MQNLSFKNDLNIVIQLEALGKETESEPIKSSDDKPENKHDSPSSKYYYRCPFCLKHYMYRAAAQKHLAKEHVKISMTLH
jgi:hypothetical protein